MLPFDIYGYGKCEKNGQCTVSFDDPTNFNIRPNYLVLDTDYDNYAIIYSCNDYFNGLFKNDVAFYLSRTPTVSFDELNRINAMI